MLRQLPNTEGVLCWVLLGQRCKKYINQTITFLYHEFHFLAYLLLFIPVKNIQTFARKDRPLNTITFTFEIFPEKRQEFMQTIRLLNKKIKQEKGLVKVNLFQDVDNSSCFNLIEEWETQDDLDGHTRSNNFRVLVGALKVLSEHSEIRYNLKYKQLGKAKILKL
jgi:quinol monooxygenase YgiN